MLNFPANNYITRGAKKVSWLLHCWSLCPAGFQRTAPRVAGFDASAAAAVIVYIMTPSNRLAPTKNGELADFYTRFVDAFIKLSPETSLWCDKFSLILQERLQWSPLM